MVRDRSPCLCCVFEKCFKSALFVQTDASHSTRLRRPASASPLKRKIPLSRRTEGWNPGPSFHQLSHLFLEFCAALFSSLVPFDLSSISLHYLCICCWCFAVPTFCTIYPCRSLPKVVLEYFWRHSSYLQVTNNTNTIQKRHENNTNNDEHGCNTNVLIPLMFHQFVPWGRDVRLVSREPARRHRSRSRWVDYLHQADRSDIGTNTST
jgi:hypothetical protein